MGLTPWTHGGSGRLVGKPVTPIRLCGRCCSITPVSVVSRLDGRYNNTAVATSGLRRGRASTNPARSPGEIIVNIGPTVGNVDGAGRPWERVHTYVGLQPPLFLPGVRCVNAASGVRCVNAASGVRCGKGHLADCGPRTAISHRPLHHLSRGRQLSTQGWPRAVDGRRSEVRQPSIEDGGCSQSRQPTHLRPVLPSGGQCLLTTPPLPQTHGKKRRVVPPYSFWFEAQIRPD